MLRRLILAVGVGLGFMPAAASVAAGPQNVATSAAPADWVAYADLVNREIAARLAGNDPVAVRLRDYMDQIPRGDVDASLKLPLHVWVDGQGVVSRVDFTLFAQRQPNDDLQGLLTGLHLQQTPPKAMLLPIRLTIRLEATPAPASIPAAL